MIRRRVLVSGRVQGVSYRASTYREALRYAGLRGFVRNLPDGRVEAIFQGEAAEVNAMIQWCRQGPSLAQVTELEVLEEAMDDESIDPSLPIFEIRRD